MPVMAVAIGMPTRVRRGAIVAVMIAWRRPVIVTIVGRRPVIMRAVMVMVVLRLSDREANA
ncbi:hypothetical protein GCM10019059_07350 [Camelimonas fluminis]|nr:hypothetical protein GCM10019059_07350 [Camelimonas fluminis]